MLFEIQTVDYIKNNAVGKLGKICVLYRMLMANWSLKGMKIYNVHEK
jgi:hypothetical protein